MKKKVVTPAVPSFAAFSRVNLRGPVHPWLYTPVGSIGDEFLQVDGVVGSASPGLPVIGMSLRISLFGRVLRDLDIVVRQLPSWLCSLPARPGTVDHLGLFLPSYPGISMAERGRFSRSVPSSRREQRWRDLLDVVAVVDADMAERWQKPRGSGTNAGAHAAMASLNSLVNQVWPMWLVTEELFGRQPRRLRAFQRCCHLPAPACLPPAISNWQRSRSNGRQGKRPRD